MFRILSTATWVLAAFASCHSEAQQQNTLPVGEHEMRGPNLPPASVSCNSDKLAFHTGVVSDYRRTTTSLTMTISTDLGTDETITIYQQEGGFEPYFSLFKRDFSEPDWLLIENESGQVKVGVRATAWVCMDGEAPPVIDWQPGYAEPGSRLHKRSQP